LAATDSQVVASWAAHGLYWRHPEMLTGAAELGASERSRHSSARGQEVSPVGFEDAGTSSLVRGTGVEAEVVGCERP
jgi:hypothetical protein